MRLTAEPATPWDSATVQVRFVAEKAPVLDGDTGWLQLEAKPRELLVVPESSVLYSGDGAYVLAAACRADTPSRADPSRSAGSSIRALSPTKLRSDSAASSCFPA